MALQPNFHVLNQSGVAFSNELAKMANLPAVAEGNAILEAIAELGNRITGVGERVTALGDRVTVDINTSADRLVTRLKARYAFILFYLLSWSF